MRMEERKHAEAAALACMMLAGAATRAGRAIILEMGATDGSIASIDGFD
jgi:hypothetical protein